MANRLDLIHRYARRTYVGLHDLYLYSHNKRILRLDPDMKDVALVWVKPEAILITPKDPDLYIVKESLQSLMEDVDSILRNSL